jgi:hypothetical protein
MAKVDYKGDYNYCYCTKSSHFHFVLHEALKNDIHLETSSAFDINIIESLYEEGLSIKHNTLFAMATNVRNTCRKHCAPGQ